MTEKSLDFKVAAFEIYHLITLDSLNVPTRPVAPQATRWSHIYALKQLM